jgi:hypothetical protein
MQEEPGNPVLGLTGNATRAPTKGMPWHKSESKVGEAHRTAGTGAHDPIITRILCEDVLESNAHIGAGELLTSLRYSRNRVCGLRTLASDSLH